MYKEIVKLIKGIEESNELGDLVSVKTEREVFANIKSIGMKEKYEALSVGLNPELVFILPDYYEYQNEEKAEYDGVEYDIIRTYRTGRTIEVVVSRARTK